MAKGIIFTYRRENKKRRPGVHAKTKTSKCKGSKNYKKIYIGQGR
jgi:hypothetical protein